MGRKTVSGQTADFVSENSIMRPLALEMLGSVSGEEQEIDRYIRPSDTKPTEIIHLHACRSGPFLANEVYLSKKEKQRNRKLKKIIGFTHPFGLFIRYLNYWLAGLNEKTSTKILNNLIFKEGRLLDYQFLLNSKIVFSLAENLHINWSSGIDIFIDPLLEDYSGLFKSLQPSVSSWYQSLRNLHKNRVLNFTEFIIFSSQFVVNKYLHFYKLSEIEFQNIEPELVYPHIRKSINLSRWQQQSKFLSLKRLRREQHAQAEIKKRLKSYNRPIKFDEFLRIVEILKSKKNRAISKIRNLSPRLSYNFILHRRGYLESELQKIFNKFEDIYSAVRFSIESNNSGLPFVTGEDMIELCFKKALKTNKTLILQKLIRPNYSKYKEMFIKYPTVTTDKSSCVVWDTSNFPEFDLNFIFGLKYLKSRGVYDSTEK